MRPSLTKFKVQTVTSIRAHLTGAASTAHSKYLRHSGPFNEDLINQGMDYLIPFYSFQIISHVKSIHIIIISLGSTHNPFPV